MSVNSPKRLQKCRKNKTEIQRVNIELNGTTRVKQALKTVLTIHYPKQFHPPVLPFSPYVEIRDFHLFQIQQLGTSGPFCTSSSVLESMQEAGRAVHQLVYVHLKMQQL